MPMRPLLHLSKGALPAKEEVATVVVADTELKFSISLGGLHGKSNLDQQRWWRVKLLQVAIHVLMTRQDSKLTTEKGNGQNQ